MTGLALRASEHSPAQALSSAPRLRLLPKAPAPRRPAERAALRPTLGLVPQPASVAAPAAAPVLIAGRDPARRAQVRQDMCEVMPAGTRFEELSTFWEVLVYAPSARMVVLSGDLEELPAESLLHTLAQRHPDLPVVSLEAQTSAK
jgi:hypothetical protein